MQNLETEKRIIKVFFSALFVLMLSIIFFILFDRSLYEYVTSKYSSYCYKEGEDHGNMKYIEKFKTLEECGKPLHD